MSFVNNQPKNYVLVKAEKVQNVTRAYVTSLLNTMRETYHITQGHVIFKDQRKTHALH